MSTFTKRKRALTRSMEHFREIQVPGFSEDEDMAGVSLDEGSGWLAGASGRTQLQSPRRMDIRSPTCSVRGAGGHVWSSAQDDHSSLPASPLWANMAYANHDCQPDFEMSERKSAEMGWGLRFLMSTPISTSSSRRTRSETAAAEDTSSRTQQGANRWRSKESSNLEVLVAKKRRIWDERVGSVA